jgi:hypothetical protein
MKGHERNVVSLYLVVPLPWQTQAHFRQFRRNALIRDSGPGNFFLSGGWAFSWRSLAIRRAGVRAVSPVSGSTRNQPGINPESNNGRPANRDC